MELPFLNTAPSTNANQRLEQFSLRFEAFSLFLERVIALLRIKKLLPFVLRRKLVLDVFLFNLHRFHLRWNHFDILNFIDSLAKHLHRLLKLRIFYFFHVQFPFNFFFPYDQFMKLC